MKFIKVIFENKNYLFTSINGSEEEIRAYYIGKYFNLGTDGDKMVKAVSVNFL